MSPAEIRPAIESEFPMAFQYRKPDGSQRWVDGLSPWQIDGGRTVIGWDHGRDEIRRFTIDGIIDETVSYPDDVYVRPQT